ENLRYNFRSVYMSSSSSSSSNTPGSDDDTKSGRSKSSNFECNICFDQASEPVVTRCGHLFCWSCLDQWLDRSGECPVCKAGVTR
ncbi:rnf5, putative, partial [Perkinsus marinus ATCC 50983]